jgi:hypothetical protein
MTVAPAPSLRFQPAGKLEVDVARASELRDVRGVRRMRRRGGGEEEEEEKTGGSTLRDHGDLGRENGARRRVATLISPEHGERPISGARSGKKHLERAAAAGQTPDACVLARVGAAAVESRLVSCSRNACAIGVSNRHSMAPVHCELKADASQAMWSLPSPSTELQSSWNRSRGAARMRFENANAVNLRRVTTRLPVNHRRFPEVRQAAPGRPKFSSAIRPPIPSSSRMMPSRSRVAAWDIGNLPRPKSL